MPYITVTTNQKLNKEQILSVKSILGENISCIPTKEERTLMVAVFDDVSMFFRGEDQPCMSVKIDVFRLVEKKYKDLYVEKISSRLEEITKVPVSSQYVAFAEYNHWGVNGMVKE